MFSPAATARADDAAPANAEASAKGDPAAAKDLGVAKKMIRSGNYSQAIPRLLKVLADSPASREGIEARYQLGVAYAAIQDLRNAETQLKQYVALAPSGEFVAEAQKQLQSLGVTLDEKYVSPDELEMKIADARRRIQEQPEEVGHRLELADLLWSKGLYADAAAVYTELLARWPSLENDTVVRQRMERSEDGTWRVLNPQTVLLQQAEKDPLVVFNTSSFRSGREEGFAQSQTPRRYNVTGEVLNRAQGALQGVELIVTIYGFGGKVYETKTVPVGAMGAGETRPFSVSFENFDLIENIERYQVKGVFRR